MWLILNYSFRAIFKHSFKHRPYSSTPTPVGGGIGRESYDKGESYDKRESYNKRESYDRRESYYKKESYNKSESYDKRGSYYKSDTLNISPNSLNISPIRCVCPLVDVCPSNLRILSSSTSLFL